MAKIELVVSDPQKYDKGLNDPGALMTYAETGSPVVIDVDTANVECEEQGKSAPINKWMADFENNRMKLADDSAEGNYQEITLMYAMNIGGQLVKEIGVAGLQRLLKTLSTVYGMSDGDSGNTEDKQHPSIPEKEDESPKKE